LQYVGTLHIVLNPGETPRASTSRQAPNYVLRSLISQNIVK